MRLAALNSDWNTYTKLDAIVIDLLHGARSEDFADDLRLQHFVSTTFYPESPIPFSERLDRALAVVKMDADGSVSKRLSAGRRPKYGLSSFAMMASVAAKTPADLNYWVTAMRRAGPDVVLRILKAFDAYSDSYSLMLGHVWQHASHVESTDWDVCLKAFDASRKLGVSVGNAWLVAASLRASMIVLDDFLGNPRASIDLASQVRNEGVDHPLIDLAEAMACYHMGDCDGTLRCVERAERNAPRREMIVERLFGLANALRAGSKLNEQKTQRISRLKWIAQRGVEISRYPRGEEFGSIARIAFTAELAWLAHEEGDYAHLVNDFEKVIEGLASFPDQTHRLFRSLRLRVGHVVAWLSQGAFKHEGLETPFPGLIANFDEPVDEPLVKPGSPYPMLWASLAEYAASANETSESRRLIRRARPSDGQQFYLGGPPICRCVIFVRSARW
jgi:hypothetical protein